MKRILALQGLTGTPFGPLMGDSNQSNHCSSETTACSTQSMGCAKDDNPLAW